MISGGPLQPQQFCDSVILWTADSTPFQSTLLPPPAYLHGDKAMEEA